MWSESTQVEASCEKKEESPTARTRHKVRGRYSVSSGGAEAKFSNCGQDPFGITQGLTGDLRNGVKSQKVPERKAN